MMFSIIVVSRQPSVGTRQLSVFPGNRASTILVKNRQAPVFRMPALLLEFLILLCYISGITMRQRARG